MGGSTCVKIWKFLRACFCGLGYGLFVILGVFWLFEQVIQVWEKLGLPSESIPSGLWWIAQGATWVLAPLLIIIGTLLSLGLLNKASFQKLVPQLFLQVFALHLSAGILLGLVFVIDGFSGSYTIWRLFDFGYVAATVAAVDCAAVSISFLATVEFLTGRTVSFLLYTLLTLLAVLFGIWIFGFIGTIFLSSLSIQIALMFSPALWPASFVGTLLALGKQEEMLVERMR